MIFPVNPRNYRIFHKFLLRMSKVELNSGADPRHPQSFIGETINEGKARIAAGPKVFYNPIQQFNRDLTIFVISQYVREKLGDDSKFDALIPGQKVEKGIRILEPMAATGLRAIRFALEIPGVEQVHANDLSHDAVQLLTENIKANGVEEIFKITEDDAVAVMFNSRPTAAIRRYDVIDIDPFGSPVPFLDSAIQALEDGGLLCVTATDAAILCGKHVETCHALYGSIGLNAPFCHEMGLRILLRAIDAHANRYGRSIEPLLAMSIDFYMRVYVRVHTGPKRAKLTCTRLSLVHRCIGCGSFQFQPMATMVNYEKDQYIPTVDGHPPNRCTDCGWRFQMGGPIWSAPTCNAEFLKGLNELISREPFSKLGTIKRLEGMIALMREELHDVPLYHVIDRLAGVVHSCSPPAVQVRSAILNAGFRVSMCHAEKASIKTDAPSSLIWDIMRTWVKDHPIKASRQVEKTAGNAILEREVTHEVSFKQHPDAIAPSKAMGLVRWEVPPPFWGPGSKKPTKAKLDKESSNQSENCDSKKSKTSPDAST